MEYLKRHFIEVQENMKKIWGKKKNFKITLGKFKENLLIFAKNLREDGRKLKWNLWKTWEKFKILRGSVEGKYTRN